MRPRFSLRTLLVLTTLLALFCYFWVIMPTQTAQQFVHAVNAEDYAIADRLASHDSDFTLSKWKDERWGFIAEAELAPWSARQLLHGTRDVTMRIKYFQLDQNFDIEMHLAATSFGLKKPDQVTMKNNAVVERIEEVSNIR
ncbi:MAG TPA: hypothetical protein VHU84_17205 [Lacipirellulaceae bacterium]|jgi:hypothetical protein|nr:hypothetical protein [Lacipirellulaceae bacterium]